LPWDRPAPAPMRIGTPDMPKGLPIQRSEPAAAASPQHTHIFTSSTPRITANSCYPCLKLTSFCILLVCNHCVNTHALAIAGVTDMWRRQPRLVVCQGGTTSSNAAHKLF
jgi:hypothetical protein